MNITLQDNRENSHKDLDGETHGSLSSRRYFRLMPIPGLSPAHRSSRSSCMKSFIVAVVKGRLQPWQARTTMWCDMPGARSSGDLQHNPSISMYRSERGKLCKLTARVRSKHSPPVGCCRCREKPFRHLRKYQLWVNPTLMNIYLNAGLLLVRRQSHCTTERLQLQLPHASSRCCSSAAQIREFMIFWQVTVSPPEE